MKWKKNKWNTRLKKRPDRKRRSMVMTRCFIRKKSRGSRTRETQQPCRIHIFYMEYGMEAPISIHSDIRMTRNWYSEVLTCRDHTLEDAGDFFMPKDQIYVAKIINDREVCQVGTIGRIRSADPTEHFVFAAIERRKENGTYGVYFPEDGN